MDLIFLWEATSGILCPFAHSFILIVKLFIAIFYNSVLEKKFELLDYSSHHLWFGSKRVLFSISEESSKRSKAKFVKITVDPQLVYLSQDLKALIDILESSKTEYEACFQQQLPIKHIHASILFLIDEFLASEIHKGHN